MEPRTNQAGIAWQPGFWRHVPWMAFFNILCFVICCVALAVILLESDGKEVTAWPNPSRTIPVSVLLSLVVSIANFCLVVALGRGYENSWWTLALKGAELRKLQFDLDIQNNIFAIFGKNLVIDKFAIAAVVSLIVSILDGPLIQRASTVSPKRFGPSFSDANIDISNAMFPADFSTFTGGGVNPQILTPLFSNVSHAYSNHEDIVLPIEGCKTNTTCVFTLPAPGFDVNCTRQLVPYDLYNLTASGFGNQISGPSSRLGNNQATTFNITISFNAFSTNAINITVLYKPDPARQGQMVQRNCVLLLATIGYPITVSDSIATLKNWDLGQNETIELTHSSSDEDLSTGSVGAGGFQTSLGGVFYVLDGLYTSYIALRIATMTNGFLFNITGQAASNYLSSDISTYSNYTMTWKDPTADIVNTARELMLRSAIAYSNYNHTAVVSQQLVMQRTKVSSSYESHYKYLAITLACMVLQALIIAFLLFGWHHLGRDMSLDAFEIARALGAPLLQGGSSNSTIQETLSPLRRDRLRYGEIVRKAVETRTNGHEYKGMVRRASENASRPGEVVQLVEPEAGNDSQRHVEQRPRLGLDREEQVRDLRLGVLY